MAAGTPYVGVEKYKGQQAVDTFFVRTGDVVSAGMVFLGTSVLALDVDGLALLILEEHGRRVQALPKSR